MEHINLNENHKRSLSATLHTVEKSILELEQELLQPTVKVTQVETDMPEGEALLHYTNVIMEIKSMVRQLTTKYDLHPREFQFSQLINSKKSVMWQILEDESSQRLKRYGDFPKEHAAEFDADIQKLLKLVESI